MSQPTTWAVLPDAGSVSSSPATDIAGLRRGGIEHGYLDSLSAATFAGEALLPPSPVHTPPEKTSSRMTVRELPPAPGSAALFLSALVSVGAWQLVRSTRQINFAAVPEWYHTGAPAQVGHAVAVNLDFGAMPLCAFAPPPVKPPDYSNTWRECRVRFAAQHTLIVQPPRGPPVRDAV